MILDVTNPRDLDERVVEMYRKVGLVLRKYRSGKIPKAFKVVPTLANWEQVGYWIPAYSPVSVMADIVQL